ncbi:MAG TPA: signal peptidase I [Candidatus Angelobacter sp.]|nr:signal peptidase I [Candidatus Angelobacter sp.]
MNWDEQSGAEEAVSGQNQPPEVPPEQNASSGQRAAELVASGAGTADLSDDGQATAPAAEAAVPPEAAAPSTRVGDQRGLFGVQAFFTVVVYSIFVITFIVQAFQIPSSSMENTLLVGDFLLVDKLHFADDAAAPGRLLPYGRIHRGDIIVFYFPVDSSQFLVKRVIGLPGDHIRLRNKIVYVNDVPLEESYAIHRQWLPDAYRDNFPAQMTYTRGIDRRWRYELQRYLEAGEVVVPQDHYFVLGDNRDDSEDSRYWGFVPRANIIGRPLVIYLSVKETEAGRSSDKLQHSGQLAHWLQMARWDRMFRLVR